MRGINLLSLLWTDGDKHVPCDHRIYDKPHDELSKNNHFEAQVKAAHSRGFQPAYACFDGGYSSLSNLKRIRQLGWHWFTRLKSNRRVDPDKSGHIPIARVNIGPQGQVVQFESLRFYQGIQDGLPRRRHLQLCHRTPLV